MTLFEPPGTVANPVPGDCYVTACDGVGKAFESYEPFDHTTFPTACLVASYCTPSGPVDTGEQNGTWCDQEQKSYCLDATCIPAPPVTCRIANTLYHRCNSAEGFTIQWSAPHCQVPADCVCDETAEDRGYCPPGTACDVIDVNGVYVGSGTCM